MNCLIAVLIGGVVGILVGGVLVILVNIYIIDKPRKDL